MQLRARGPVAGGRAGRAAACGWASEKRLRAHGRARGAPVRGPRAGLPACGDLAFAPPPPGGAPEPFPLEAREALVIVSHRRDLGPDSTRRAAHGRGARSLCPAVPRPSSRRGRHHRVQHGRGVPAVEVGVHEAGPSEGGAGPRALSLPGPHVRPADLLLGAWRPPRPTRGLSGQGAWRGEAQGPGAASPRPRPHRQAGGEGG